MYFNTNSQRIAILQMNNLYVAPKPRKKRNQHIQVVTSSNAPNVFHRALVPGRQNESSVSRTTHLGRTSVNHTFSSVDVRQITPMVSQLTFALNEEVRNIHGLQAHITKVNKDGTYDVRCKLCYNIIMNVLYNMYYTANIAQ